MKRTRVRVYCPYFPYPPRDGSAFVVFDEIRTLSEMGFEVELICWWDTEDSAREKMRIAYIEPFPSNVRTIFLPRSQSGSAFKRALRVGRSLFSEFSSPEFYYYPPEQRPILTETVDLALYHYSFSYPWLKESEKPSQSSSKPQHKCWGAGRSGQGFKPRPSTARELPLPKGRGLLSLEKKKVVVFHNLESELFRQRALQEKSPIQSWIHQLNHRKLNRHEKQLEHLVDEVWFISPEDQKRYQATHPGAGLTSRYVPPGFSEEFYQKRLESFRASKAQLKHPILGFIGSLDFFPNQEGVLWILNELAPRLQAAQFQGELRIAGKGASLEIQDKANAFPFVRFLGFLPEIEEFWSSLDFSLVPHFSGSGVRIKLLESLASGIPTLTTTGASARIHPELRNCDLLLVSNDPQEWVRQILNPPPSFQRKNLNASPLPLSLNTKQVYAFAETWKRNFAYGSEKS